MDEARKFYGDLLGMKEARSSDKWVEYDFYGNKVFCHFVGIDYRGVDYVDQVGGDEVPVPHFGACISLKEFNDLAEKLKKEEFKFLVEPHLIFEGQNDE